MRSLRIHIRYVTVPLTPPAINTDINHVQQKTYNPPIAPPLDTPEARSVASFVSFRNAFHTTPFYTHRHLTNTSADDDSSSQPTAPPRRTYGQVQLNARFAVKNRATLDPFQGVPMYSHRFQDEYRTLPDLKARAAPYIKALFPEELWGTLDGRDAGGPKGGYEGSKPVKSRGAAGSLKRKAAATLDRDTYNDEDIDADDADDDETQHTNLLRRRRQGETEEQRKARIELAIKEGENEDENKEGGGGGGGGDVELDEEEEEMLSQEDDDYGDDEGGDYDAEAYFENGDADDMGDDEGVGESAMDF